VTPTGPPGPPVGLVLGSMLAPERIAETARLAERLGYGEVWLSEDAFFTGGISGVTAALAATERIPVGLGVVSAMTRHPALLAMELATVARMHPGRLRPGIGLGVPGWLRQMGLWPRSQLTAIRECLTAVRRLLAGEEVTDEGASFQFRSVRLTYPLAEPLPIYMGVVGPRMLRLSGEIADGNVLSVLAGLDYVRWAKEQIAAGAAEAGRPGPRPLTLFALFSVDRDGQRARDAVRGAMAFYLADDPRNALTEVYGVADELVELAAGGVDRLARELPAPWIEDLAIAGDPDECARKLRGYLDAGVDSIALVPVPADRAREMVELAASRVLPAVG
jgi:5,10-methylenetetrahydromethanopterin reductase